MSHTKAVHLKSLKKFVSDRGGEEAWGRLLADLDPKDRAQASKPLLSHEWLEYSLWWRLLLSADRVLGKGDRAIIREIGAFDAIENLNSIYRVFLTFLSPEFIISRTQVIWRQYYDIGRMEAVRVERKRAEVHLFDFPDLPEGHELEILGWIEAALKLTGISRLQVTHPGPCLARGDDHCGFVVTWE